MKIKKEDIKIDSAEVNQFFAMQNKLDANESYWFLRELEYVKSQVLETPQENIYYTKYLPVSNEIDQFAESFTFRTITGVGLAKIITSYSDDIPSVDVYGKETTARVRRLAESFTYSTDEVQRSAQSRSNLPTQKATVARNYIELGLNTAAFTGYADFGIYGLCNFPGITSYTVPNGVGGLKTWASKTADEILVDLNGIYNAVVNTTNGIEIVSHILLPLTQLQEIKNKRLPDTNVTVYNFWTSNNPGVVIDSLPLLKGFGVGGTNRFIAFNSNPTKVQFHVPLAFNQLAPQQNNFYYKVACEAKTAGTTVYFPLSVAYGDGI